MTAVLVTASDCKVHMNVTSTGDDSLIQTYVDAVEQLFVAQCGRNGRPFATSATGRSEVQAGTGTPLLVLDYPVSSASGITSLKIGYDVSNPDETLTATDIDTLTVATGSRNVWRTDGAHFGKLAEPRVVHITYNHNGDTTVEGTDAAKLAIKRAVAAVYRQRGSEDAKSETLPNGYQRTIEEVCSGDRLWHLAVAANGEPAVTA